MIKLIKILNSKELFFVISLIFFQFILAITEPILLAIILKSISSLVTNSSIISIDIFFVKFDFNRINFYKFICTITILKVVFSLIVMYLQNFISFHLSQKFSFKIIESYYNSSIDYLIGITKTEKVRFILIEMETIAKSGFQNFFLLVTEIFIILSILIYIIIENGIFNYKLLFITPVLMMIYLYFIIVRRKSRKLGNLRSINDNAKMSLVTGLFQDVILFKLVNLDFVKIKLSKLFKVGIKISAFQTTIEGSFKLLLESLLYIIILLTPLIISSNDFSFEKLSFTFILIMRLIPSVSRILSITAGFSYIKYIIHKLSLELSNVK
jgi:hypothetical protein